MEVDPEIHRAFAPPSGDGIGADSQSRRRVQVFHCRRWPGRIDHSVGDPTGRRSREGPCDLIAANVGDIGAAGAGNICEVSDADLTGSFNGIT